MELFNIGIIVKCEVWGQIFCSWSYVDFQHRHGVLILLGTLEMSRLWAEGEKLVPPPLVCNDMRKYPPFHSWRGWKSSGITGWVWCSWEINVSVECTIQAGVPGRLQQWADPAGMVCCSVLSLLNVPGAHWQHLGWEEGRQNRAVKHWNAWSDLTVTVTILGGVLCGDGIAEIYPH